MRTKVLSVFLILLFICCGAAWCQEADYRTVNTSRGKVLTGLSRERALELFGVPSSVGNDIWHYADREQFVYFPQKSFAQVFLYPPFLELTSAGVPVEFKVFGYQHDFTVRDITDSAEFIISDKESFSKVKPGVFIPRKEGKFQLLASAQDATSNPAFVVIKKDEEKKASGKERCLAIYVLPYQPRLKPESRVEFVALGIFFASSEKSYTVKDISRQAQWFLGQGEAAEPLGGALVTAPASEGKYGVFCTYDELKSYPQEMTVAADALLRPPSEIGNILVLPEFIFAGLNDSIVFKAFATHGDYSVKEASAQAKWKAHDSEILIPFGGGIFSCRSEGVSDVSAEAKGRESQSAKVIVAKIEGDDKAQAAKKEMLALQTQDSSPESKDTEELVEEMSKEAENLEQSAAEEERTLKAIKLIPESLTIHLGESGQVAAMGVYSDNAQEDITLLVSWDIVAPEVCGVERGTVTGKSMGESRIYAKFEGVTSAPATVIVEGPRLISISVIPPEAIVPMGTSLDLRAEGYFSDASRKDITPTVDWVVSDRRIIKVNKKAELLPVAMGKAQVYAVHKELRSLPADIKVVFSFLWLLKRIAVALGALLLFAAMLFTMLFAFTEREKAKLRRMIDKDPRGFIVALYENAVNLLDVFSFRPKTFLAPRGFARMADAAYKTQGDQFLRFTAKFQEAQYSSHIQRVEDALFALGDYNDFFKTVVSRQPKVRLALRFAVSLFKTRPLFIPGP
ncbi:MAG: hypothetical protein PHR11_03395 [Candidatus Omnitrophica bacterium]|nr:hypothetical protein [Candidatus Omnitrophota bacterium]